jgi:hypothetical protein
MNLVRGRWKITDFMLGGYGSTDKEMELEAELRKQNITTIPSDTALPEDRGCTTLTRHAKWPFAGVGRSRSTIIQAEVPPLTPLASHRNVCTVTQEEVSQTRSNKSCKHSRSNT